MWLGGLGFEAESRQDFNLYSLGHPVPYSVKQSARYQGEAFFTLASSIDQGQSSRLAPHGMSTNALPVSLSRGETPSQATSYKCEPPPRRFTRLGGCDGQIRSPSTYPALVHENQRPSQPRRKLTSGQKDKAQERIKMSHEYSVVRRPSYIVSVKKKSPCPTERDWFCRVYELV